MSKLKEILKSLKPEKASKFRVIILCVLAATTFKFFNSLNSDYSTTLNYPLEFIYDKGQYIPLEDLPENVQLNVSGLGWNLFRNSLGIKVSPVQIPLEKPTELKRIPGALIPGFISDQISEFELNYVLTDTLYVNLDKKDSKLFYIRVDSANISLDDEHKIVSSVKSTPDTVRLSGPSTMLSQLSDTLLIALPEKNLDSDYDDDVVINIPNARLIKRNPPTVNISFEIKEFRTVQQEIPLDTVSFPPAELAYPSAVTIGVSYEVARDDESEVDLTKFKAVLDFNQLSQDSTISPQLISQPKEVHNVRIDTSVVKILFND